MHNLTSPNENLFAGQLGTVMLQPIYANMQGYTTLLYQLKYYT